MLHSSGGESGIRTHEGLFTLTRVPGVRLQPLGHLSSRGGEGGIRTHGRLITYAGFQDRCIQPALPPPLWKDHCDVEAPPGFEPGIRALQAPALATWLWRHKAVVPEAGLEPARRKAPRDFKSLASTNSATRA